MNLVHKTLLKQHCLLPGDIVIMSNIITPLILFVFLYSAVLSYEPFHLFQQIYPLGLTSQMFESQHIYTMPLSHFLALFCIHSLSYVYDNISVRISVEFLQCFHGIFTAVDLGCRNVADSLKMRAQVALATHMAVIYLRHVLLLPQTGAQGMMPTLLSFLLQNMDLQSAV